MNNEVEIRSFLVKSQYETLRILFATNATELLHTRQVTYYLDSEIDTRVQITANGGKVWQKTGTLHDISRGEVEARMSRESAHAMLYVFENMGYKVKVAWYRERRKYRFREFTVCLDNTIGYGMILEAELMCDSSLDSVAAARQALETVFAELGVHVDPVETFSRAFDVYLKNWKTLTAHLSEAWLES